MKSYVSTIIFSAGVILGSAAFAAPPTFTEDYNVPLEPIDGKTLEKVDYSFTINGSPSGNAAFGAGGPGILTYVQDPSIEGSTSGEMKLVFAKPTTIIQFGVAMNTMGNLSDGVNVELYRPGAGRLRQRIELATSSNPTFTEGLFEYRGPAVKTMIVTFDNTQASRFAFDNLVYHKKPGN